MGLESIKIPSSTFNLSWLEILDISTEKSEQSSKNITGMRTHTPPSYLKSSTEKLKNGETLPNYSSSLLNSNNKKIILSPDPFLVKNFYK